NLFGRGKKESEELTASLVEQAAALGWPVILHADLNRYLDFVTALLQSSPKTPFLIPHFGFTRKRMAGLLERFPQCFTDFSSLLPFMLEKPKAYKEFILTHQDRVLFGTDATLGWPQMVEEYLSFTSSLLQGKPALQKVLSGNYKRIHKP
ncbi:MAG: amidohydrolase, partial [Desulfohalobiaceae bacterium]|nr:amidohydrolase [Desulfohalobiaceae bacterium]